MCSPARPIYLMESPQQCTLLMSPRPKCGFRGGFGEVVGPTREPRSGPPRQPTPQGPNPATASEEVNNAVLGLSLPRKLWMIVEDAAFTSVHWNDEGDMVVIEADLFQVEVFQRRGTDRIFDRQHQDFHSQTEPVCSVKCALQVALQGRRG